MITTGAACDSTTSANERAGLRAGMARKSRRALKAAILAGFHASAAEFNPIKPRSVNCFRKNAATRRATPRKSV